MTSLLFPPPQDNLVPGEEGDRSFRDLCDLSENDSEGGSVSPREPLSSPHAHRSSPTPTNPNSHHDLNMNAAGAAAELSAAAQRFITQQLSTVPMELELRPSGSGVGLGVWTKQTITRGTRYGPFLGKWTANAKDPSFAWEVVSARSGLRGWLDAGEMGNWLRHICVASGPVFGNLRHLLLAGQIFYEATRDIPVGEELLLIRKAIIDLDASASDDQIQVGSPEDRSENTGDDDDDDDDDELARFRCLQCDKNFPDYDELDDHLVTAHGYAAGQYRCDYCPRAFAWRPNLIQHKTVHGEYKRYPCENCPRVFTDAVILQKHIRNQHAGARSHACPECGKTFATSSGLKQHTHIHSSVKPFQCEVCFKAYTQFSNLCRHKRMHADCRLQIKCTKCGQAFSTVTSLAKHKRFCDTAPTLSLQHCPPSMMDNKQAHTGLSMANMPSSPPNPFMMYHRPPLPLLPPSLLSNYPMFHSIPSLVGGPQHPLLTSSLLLPFQNNSPRDQPCSTTKEEKESNDSGSRMVISPRPESTESPVRESPASLQPPPYTSPSHSPKQASVFPMRESPRRSETNDVPDEHRLSPDLHRRTPEPPVKKEPPAESTRGPGEKREQPLDLTLRRKEGERDELFLGRFDILSHSSDSAEERLRSPAPPEVKSVVEPRPRVDHPFLRISELLKDTTTTTSSHPPPPQPPCIIETPSKLPLAYPRPLHPALLDMYRNLDRSLERSPLLPGGGLPSTRYPLLPPYFPPTSMAGMGLGLNRSAGLDMLKAHMSTTARPYGDISRPYDLMATHMPRAKDRYSCKFCGKVFPRSANLTRHLRTHTGEQPYKCKYCERSFSISSNLQRHVRNIHNKEKPFKCPLCDRCFGQQTNLDRHLKKHELEGPNPPDSPEAPDSSSASVDTSTNFFSDEIRSFVDKVTDSTTDDIMVDDDAMDEDDDDKDQVTTSRDGGSSECTVKRVRVE